MDIAAREQHRPGPATWIYIGLSIAVLVLAAMPMVMQPRTDTALWIRWLGLVTSAAPVISAAAFHRRHPGAWRSARTIAIAFTVLAVASFMSAAGSLEGTIGDVNHSVEQVSTGAYLGAAAEIPQVVGALLLWIGLRRVRRRASRGRSLVLVAVWIVLGIELALLAGLFVLYAIDGGSGLILGLLALIVIGPLVLVPGLLATELVRGAQAGERPKAGWWAGGIGWAIELVATPLVIATEEVGSLGLAVAGACMIAAFAVGLPAIDEPPADASGPLGLTNVG